MASKRGQVVLLDLRRLVAGLATEVGARLAPERELAGQLGCSRETLRGALQVLEREGEIWRHVGQGTFCGPRPLGHPIPEQIIVQGASPMQLMQARQTIEPSVAAEAARLATAEQAAHLADLARRGRSARTRPESEQLDAAFHRGIAEVTGNPILLGLLDYLAGVRRHAAWQREWELTYRKLGVSEFTQRHTAQHEAIAAAISLRDPDRAAAAMQAHLDTISTAMRGAGLPGLGAKGWAPRT
ncbi:FadR/GntR family transcriptional regulator [Salipiger sp. PrR007]|uniref:FadR/GntR family transcriptional regulator n=1 Tax=Salipiger sp. PrR007 TaxID=2706884 RepID=UPI0013BE6FDA|nr:FCD domain-containing protein [Salipiger sp. PrR007]NDW33389.1 FadR family transcriptional regulator [Salipiger sp. PrR007]